MNESTVLSFNLVDQPWLPVSLNDGTVDEWSLREFFARAQEARGLNEPSPLSYTALTRFLLAILHRSHTGPKDITEWRDLMIARKFNSAVIDAYLARWEHRFDLYHPERPFAQVNTVETMTKNSRKPITQLFLERTSGNNPTLFDHSVDLAPIPLSPGEAARAVITANQYGFAGSQIFSNTPMIAGYCVMLEGSNLFETLMLNLVLYDNDRPKTLEADNDGPWWEFEHDPPIVNKGEVSPRGLTDLLTWRGRKIRLLPEPDGSAAWVNYAPRYVVSDPEFRLRDPFKRYVMATTGQNKGKSFPKNFSTGRALWRDSATLLEHSDPASGDPNGRPVIVEWWATISNFLKHNGFANPTLIVTGLVNNQAKVDLWRIDRLPIPPGILQQPSRIGEVKRAIEIADRIRHALQKAGTEFAKVALSKGERSPDPNDIARERAALRLDSRYWSRLEPLFQRFLAALEQSSQDNEEEPYKIWSLELYQIAVSVFREAILSTGDDSRWLKAEAFAERELMSQFNRFIPEIREFRDQQHKPVAVSAK